MIPQQVWGLGLRYFRFLRASNWETDPHLTSSIHVADRSWSRAPVLQPSPLDPDEAVNVLEFFHHYHLIEWSLPICSPDSWLTAKCSCKQHISKGVCGHVIAIFLRCGGELSEKQKIFMPVLDVHSSDPNRLNHSGERSLRAPPPHNISHYFPSAQDASRRLNRDALSAREQNYILSEDESDIEITVSVESENQDDASPLRRSIRSTRGVSTRYAGS